MTEHVRRSLGVLACLAGIIICVLWAAGPLGWREPVALGVILALAFVAILVLLLP